MLAMFLLAGVVCAYLWLVFDGARIHNLYLAKRKGRRNPWDRKTRRKRAVGKKGGDEGKEKAKPRRSGRKPGRSGQLELFGEEHTGPEEDGFGPRGEERVSEDGGTTFTPP